MKIKPGFYPDMSMEDYHAHKASYSRSDLIEIAKTPAHLHYKKTTPEEKKQDKFELGTATHSAILEGLGAYIERAAIVPEDVLGKNGARSTNAYKQWAADNANKTILLKSQVEQVRGAYEAAMRRRQFKKYLTGGKAEVSAFWHMAYGGHKVLFKCRPDYLPGHNVVTDLKTTSILLDDWPRYAANSKAHWSAYLTCKGLTELTGIQHTEYLFAVIEINPPFDARIFRTPPEYLELAQYELEDLIPELIMCDASDTWPGSKDELIPLEYPYWALKNLPETSLAADY